MSVKTGTPSIPDLLDEIGMSKFTLLEFYDKFESQESRKNWSSLRKQWEQDLGNNIGEVTSIGVSFQARIRTRGRPNMFRVENRASDRAIKRGGVRYPHDVVVAFFDGLRNNGLDKDLLDIYREQIRVFPGFELQGPCYTASAPLAEMSQKDIDDFIKLHQNLVERWRARLCETRA